MSPQPDIEPPQTDRGVLLRILGVGFGVAISIGGTIGVGILRTPGTVAAQLGSYWTILAVWALGGVYALCGAISVAELSTSLPRAGGWYVYARRAFGNFTGFTVGWCDWLSGASAFAFTITVSGEYVTRLWPAFAHPQLAGLLFVTPLVILNCVGLRPGSRFQEWSSFLKTAAFLGMVGAIFMFGGGQSGVSEPPLRASVSIMALLAAVSLAFQPIIYAYDGWYGPIYLAEENRNPSRSLPRALMFGVLTVTVVYLLINLAFLHALSVDQLAASTLPAADAARQIFGEASGRFITVLALLTLASLANAQMLVSPRILFAIGRDSGFAPAVTRVNAGGTPARALLVLLCVSTLLVVTGTYNRLLGVTTFLFVLSYGSGFLAVLVLRWKEPKLERPYKAWGYPWTTIVVLIGSLVFLIAAILNDTRNSLYAAALIGVSVPLYLLTRRPVQP